MPLLRLNRLLALAALTLLAHPAQAGPLRDWLTERRHKADSSDEVEAVGHDAEASDALADKAQTWPDIAYGPSAAQRMDVYAPRQARGAAVILMVHGGAWAIGDKRHAPVVRHKVAHLAKQGVIFISVNYRMLPATMPLEQAHDVARALAYAQNHAADWGGDPPRFVLMGHSAGAHLVAPLSANPGLAAADGAKPWLGTVMLDSAALDVSKIMRSPKHPALYDRAFGSVPAYWAAVSPIDGLQAKAPPMLAVCSTKRKDSCDQADAFVSRANQLGVTATVLRQDLSHGDINAQLGQDGAYTDAVDQFLAALPGFRRAPSQ